MGDLILCPNGDYCDNGGSCSEDPDRTCDCTDEWSGDRCETKRQDEAAMICTLECLHDGLCMHGQPPDHDLMRWPGEVSDKMHCKCPTGYGGHFCEYRVDVCGEYERICLHGKKCAKKDDTFTCECDPSDASCGQQHQVEYCLPKSAVEYHRSMAAPAFCVNGGKCVDVLEDGFW